MSFDATQRGAAPDDVAWLAELNARATLTQQRLAELKTMLDEMRMERDAWRDQALRLALPAPGTLDHIVAVAALNRVSADG